MSQEKQADDDGEEETNQEAEEETHEHDDADEMKPTTTPKFRRSLTWDKRDHKCLVAKSQMFMSGRRRSLGSTEKIEAHATSKTKKKQL